MAKPFKLANDKELGDDWLICFGNDGKDNWYITTDHIHGSELADVSSGVKGDAENVLKALNDYPCYPGENLEDYVARRIESVFLDVAAIAAKPQYTIEILSAQSRLLAAWREIANS